MPYQIIFTSKAQEEFLEIWHWYEKIEIGLVLCQDKNFNFLRDLLSHLIVASQS